jgi:hypothetical protein
MRVFVEAVGLAGPGLPGWTTSRRVLAAKEPYNAAPTVVPVCDLLPAAERRRSGATIRLALAVAQEAFAQSGRDPAVTPTVFASSSGDGDTLDNLCTTLATEERDVSPTRFHTSVHNAPAGYWSICTGCQEAYTSVCGHDWTFPAALLEAATQVATTRAAVTLVAYDLPYPEPLHAVRPLAAVFGVALVLAPAAGARTFASLDIAYAARAAQATTMKEPALEKLRSGSPPARSLPLLAALARGSRSTIVLPYEPGTLTVEATPCSSTVNA